MHELVDINSKINVKNLQIIFPESPF